VASFLKENLDSFEIGTNGYISIPGKTYSIPEINGEFNLQQWARFQRHQYKKLQSGQKSQLRGDRVKFLKGIPGVLTPVQRDFDSVGESSDITRAGSDSSVSSDSPAVKNNIEEVKTPDDAKQVIVPDLPSLQETQVQEGDSLQTLKDTNQGWTAGIASRAPLKKRMFDIQEDKASSENVVAEPKKLSVDPDFQPVSKKPRHRAPFPGYHSQAGMYPYMPYASVAPYHHWRPWYGSSVEMSRHRS